MSADYYIYTDHIDEFDKADFEMWAAAQGYELELHPDFSIRENGFVPIRFRADFLGEGSWKTGFELFSSANDSTDLTAEPVEEPAPKKLGFFAKLFGKKQQPAAMPPVFKVAPEPGEPSPFELAVREKKWEVSTACFGSEPLEQLSCYLFAGYFCEKFGAVVDDPQLGRFYKEPWDIKLEFEAIKEDILANHTSWGMDFLPFNGWQEG